MTLPWFDSLMTTLDQLEGAAAGGDNTGPAITAAAAALASLEQKLSTLSPAERAAVVPHLPRLLARLAVVEDLVKTKSDALATHLSGARARAAALKGYAAK